MNSVPFAMSSHQPERVQIRRRGRRRPETATGLAADTALRTLIDSRRGLPRGTSHAGSDTHLPELLEVARGAIETLGLSALAFRVAVLVGVMAVLTVAVLRIMNAGPPIPLRRVIARVQVDRFVPVGATVTLHPTERSLPEEAVPRGTVREDGSVIFTTYPPFEGVPVGTYVATIQWFRVAHDGSVGRNALPARYSSPTSSHLEVTVSTDSAASPTLHLSSK